MGKVTEQMKLEIVIGLAHFNRPTDIKKRFKEEYDIDLDLPQISQMNPERACYTGAEKFIAIFHEERKRYIDSVTEVPIANQGFRMQELNRNYMKARDANNMMLCNQILKQAAEEVGGVLTNQRSLTVSDERRKRLDEMGPDERREALTELLQGVLGEAEQVNGITTPTEQ